MSISKHILPLALIVWISPLWVTVSGASGEPQAFIPNSVHEFKPVVEGTRINHEFTIENRGSAPLEILHLHSG